MTQRTALYRVFDAANILLYCGVSASPDRRFAEHSSRSVWFDQISRVEVQWFESRAEALQAERIAILSEAPKHNKTLSRAARDIEVVDLRTWLIATGTVQHEFCALIGVGQPYLSKLITRKQLPSIQIAWAIERETAGAIPMQSWMATPTRSAAA